MLTPSFLFFERRVAVEIGYQHQHYFIEIFGYDRVPTKTYVTWKRNVKGNLPRERAQLRERWHSISHTRFPDVKGPAGWIIRQRERTSWDIDWHFDHFDKR